MNELSFQSFEAEARAQGFDEVLERVWQPHTVLDTHVHPFAVKGSWCAARCGSPSAPTRGT
jgi:hypothetical protein